MPANRFESPEQGTVSSFNVPDASMPIGNLANAMDMSAEEVIEVLGRAQARKSRGLRRTVVGPFVTWLAIGLSAIAVMAALFGGGYVLGQTDPVRHFAPEPTVRPPSGFTLIFDGFAVKGTGQFPDNHTALRGALEAAVAQMGPPQAMRYKHAEPEVVELALKEGRDLNGVVAWKHAEIVDADGGKWSRRLPVALSPMAEMPVRIERNRLVNRLVSQVLLPSPDPGTIERK